MKNKENEVNVLDEVNKGACMGLDAIHFIIDKVKDKELLKEINRQAREYEEISEEICSLYPEYACKDDSPDETNAMNKAMTWYGIEMRTILDSSDSKIAELLMQGTNMGIIEGRKLLNHKNTDRRVEDIAERFVRIQEKAIEKLKSFL